MSEIRDAYAARKAADVRQDTWGHLQPKADTRYEGFILYAQGECGDLVVIEFVGDNGEQDGRVYLWRGSYSRSRGGKKFRGQFWNVSGEQLCSVFHQLKSGGQ